MCGIAGFINFDGGPAKIDVLRAITETLRHRGPDGEGYEIVGNLALGHRRLSIIDLSLGHQPLYSHDREYLITFNGEIFNYIELRAELLTRGAHFRTNSDTEVIIELFRAEGVAGLARLNGMFAFALYHVKERRLIFARDRMGEKPLFISIVRGNLVFGSELKVIFRYKEIAQEAAKLDRRAFLDLLSLNYVPFSRTMLEGVRSLEPGCYLEITDGKFTEQTYLSSSVPIQNSSDLSSSLRRSTELRLRSDVPVGVFLSGGVDSTLVSHYITTIRSGVKAFIADFSEAGFSERENALAVAAKLGLSTEVITVSGHADIAALIEELVYHGDTPLADSSSLPMYLLSKATSKHVKVVLSGDGGDELFGGYLTYRATLAAAVMPAAIRSMFYRLRFITALFPASNQKVGFLEKLDRFLRNLKMPPAAAHFAWNGMFSVAERARLVNAELRSQATAHDTFTELALKNWIDLDKPSIKQLLFADQRSYLCDDILVKADRMSMAHGLEIRPVFMDTELIELSRTLPENLLVNHFQGRIALREVIKNELPWYDLNRPKQGFSIPIHLWLRTRLKDFAADLFNSVETKECGLFDQSYLLKIWDDHQKRKRNIGFELWGVMVALLWMRRFKVSV